MRKSGIFIVLITSTMRINERNEIDLTEIRPHFKLQSTLEVDEALEAIRTAIRNANPDEVRCTLQHDHAQFKVPAQYEHYWSPVLHVGFEKPEQGSGTLLRCLVGPSQAVWAMFVLVYGAIGILFFFGLFYGTTKYQLDGDARFLWSLPLAAALFVGIWLGAKMGQRKGHHQMDELIRFFVKSLAKGQLRNED